MVRFEEMGLIAIFGSIVVALIGYFYTAQDLPPYPKEVVSKSGDLITGKAKIMAG